MTGFSLRRKRMLSPKSFRTVSRMPPEAGFRKGMWRNSSIIADSRKHAMQTHRTGLSPQALYRTPPSTGPARAAKELTVLITEFAAI